MGCEFCGSAISGLVVGAISVISFVFMLMSEVLIVLAGWIGKKMKLTR